MLLLIKVTALQLVWLACLPIYLASQQQVFLKRSVNKKMAWFLFSVFSLIATLMLTKIYHPLTASIFTLVVWMTAWIVLALWSPYRASPKKVVISGSLFAFLVALLGGPYVD